MSFTPELRTETQVLRPKRALLSVSDKTDLIPLARALVSVRCELFASGGTLAALKEAGIQAQSIEKISRSPEAFQGRMKTLSFPVFSGILARRNDSSDDFDREKLGIPTIDVVVVNFYPFEKAPLNADETSLTELIDIGGPALVRAAAKNQKDVLVLSDPLLYGSAIGELNQDGGFSREFRKKAANRAWSSVCAYDEAIAKRLSNGPAPFATPTYTSTPAANKTARKTIELKYGENPHQKARFEMDLEGSPIAWDTPLTQSEISYNNILDFTAGYRLLSDLHQWKPEAAHAVIIKHQNPCGVSTNTDGKIEDALEMAWSCDPTSAFGGMVLLSKPLNEKSARFLSERFIEGIASYGLTKDDGCLSLLTIKRKNLKALTIRTLLSNETRTQISVPGGVLYQDADPFGCEEIKVMSGGNWGQDRIDLAQFGIQVAKSLKSNAIVLVETPTQSSFRILGAGQGQPNRIDAILKLAIPRAREILTTEARSGSVELEAFIASRLREAILISDAFFPFSDSIVACAQSGVQWIVEPGGSIRDRDVIASAESLGVKLAFTGIRHFRH